MNYAIIGFGEIGKTPGQGICPKRHRGGSVATTRDPETFAAAAAEIGPGIMPKKLAEAAKADVIFLLSGFSSIRMSRRHYPIGRARSSST